MRAFQVIMFFKLGAEHIHVLVAEDNKMVKDLLLNTLHESLNKGHGVRRTYGCPMQLDFPLSKYC